MARLPRPEGHHTVTPSFAVPGAADVIGFMETAFGGELVERYDGPGDSVAHAEVRLGDSVVMLGDASPETPPMPAMLTYYVDDGPAVDAAYQRALENGASALRAPEDQFYGYRSARVSDPGGNHWTICAVVEQLSEEEIKRRMSELMPG
ncbi:MAG: VOC family protein [Pseudomonadota bacterium]